MSTTPISVIACGALSAGIRRIAIGRGLDIDLHVLPALLHDHPEAIAPRVESLARSLQASGRTVAVAYADCGTYGALDQVCESLGLPRLGGAHCYDVIAGTDTVRELFAQEPGTYLLTDFLVRSFRRTVVAELGLDSHPELVGDYFKNYRRIVWLAEDPFAGLEADARAVGELLGLPVERLEAGTGRLEAELEALVAAASATPCGRVREGLQA
ncbi:MAG: DUF1638 domain-containing protein [Acidimicrobiales bacterium]